MTSMTLPFFSSHFQITYLHPYILHMIMLTRPVIEHRSTITYLSIDYHNRVAEDLRGGIRRLLRKGAKPDREVTVFGPTDGARPPCVSVCGLDLGRLLFPTASWLLGLHTHSFNTTR
jgi:hypothetical protein